MLFPKIKCEWPALAEESLAPNTNYNVLIAMKRKFFRWHPFLCTNVGWPDLHWTENWKDF